MTSWFVVSLKYSLPLWKLLLKYSFKNSITFDLLCSHLFIYVCLVNAKSTCDSNDNRVWLYTASLLSCSCVLVFRISAVNTNDGNVLRRMLINVKEMLTHVFFCIILFSNTFNAKSKLLSSLRRSISLKKSFNIVAYRSVLLLSTYVITVL